LNRRKYFRNIGDIRLWIQGYSEILKAFKENSRKAIENGRKNSCLIRKLFVKLNL
jgi:hypothetical protein